MGLLSDSEEQRLDKGGLFFQVSKGIISEGHFDSWPDSCSFFNSHGQILFVKRSSFEGEDMELGDFGAILLVKGISKGIK